MFRHLSEAYAGKNILVTGGFGFVGSHLTKALVEIGANVTVFDLRTDTSIDSLLNDPLLTLRNKIRIVKGDLSDRSLVFETVSKGKFDYAFNLASYATVIEKAVENPYETIQTNTVGVINLLDSFQAMKVKPIRIFHASTDKVYGEMDGEPYDEEKTPLRGIGLYDSSKLAADLFVRTYHEVYGLPITVLRMCNIFGPADFNTRYRLIPRALSHLFAYAEPRSPELYFDSLEHWRDYLYIDDCIRAILLVAYRDNCAGEVVNLSAAKFISTPALLKCLVKSAYEIESEFDPIRADAILNGGISLRVRDNGPGVLIISKQRLNGNKIKKMTGFEPLIEFQEGIDRTIRAYRDYYTNRDQFHIQAPTQSPSLIEIAGPSH